MTDTKLEFEQIPPEQIASLARSALRAIRAYYEDPENMRKFKEWEETQKKCEIA